MAHTGTLQTCQGLVTDTPFYVTESTRLPPLVQHLGQSLNGCDCELGRAVFFKSRAMRPGHVTDGDPAMVAERQLGCN